MRAVITVTGKDRTGIIAKISKTLYEHQSTSSTFPERMEIYLQCHAVNIDKCTVDFNTLIDLLTRR